MKAPCQSAFPFILQHHTHSPPCLCCRATFMHCCCNGFFRDVSCQFLGFYKCAFWVFSWAKASAWVHTWTYLGGTKSKTNLVPVSRHRRWAPGLSLETGQESKKATLPGEMQGQPRVRGWSKAIYSPPERCVHWESAGVAHTAAVARNTYTSHQGGLEPGWPSCPNSILRQIQIMLVGKTYAHSVNWGLYNIIALCCPI